ncbi:DUF4129 domain-containing protein [Halopiger xanaduensis]|uniref:Protein-glutamine gamma-glutamyltransferase-like C-terminal domain-containing protein n=1 Tax=Halopiger xanaduensis (strain DSM 18323 / JCM 14033 / SH-6) TaxID=797210 RepID=F8D6D2_HALXS|nr:DUF4129 domain-containing protein [Halopiger xanaduensis]AEH35384.1 hypothetical protein Halxa_0745 [Halopiger xanaduensis SH-6]
MSSNTRLVRLLAAVSAIAAIALAAATIENPLETGGSEGVGPGEGGGPGQQPMPTQPVAGGDAPPFLEYLVYAVLIIIAVALVWYLLAYRRDAVKMIAVVLAVCLVGALLFAFLFQGFSPELDAQPIEEPATVNNSSGGGDFGSGEGETDSFSTGPLLFVLSVITAIFVGGLLVSRRGGNSESDAPPVVENEPDESGTEAAAVGSAAGRAADRIDGAATDVDNEIYRAWKEMTALLEVDRPDSSTPREFATAAVEAGIDREYVGELTRLFEEVRYGDVETTSEMETRAVDVLRRIEDEYAAGDERGDRTDGGTDDAGTGRDASGGGGR